MSEFDDIALDTALQQVITSEQAWHYRIIPKNNDEHHLVFYTDGNLSDKPQKEELEVLFSKEIVFEKIPSEVFQKTLGKYYRRTDTKTRHSKILEQRSEDFLQSLISEARSLGSSDIHIESYEEKCRVRMRIDGHMIERYLIKKEDYPRMVNKVKIQANLDIAEKRLPQDGRIFFQAEQMKFDIRVSVLPTIYGEKVVLRILSNDATNIDIEKLGFSERELEYYLEGVKRPNGIMLISDPTGSGKTTTLYATLKLLNKEKTNILTVEDPVEYTLAGINQVQLKESIGLTFASALRTFLRQDPDIIMLGEIRDGETAQMAIRAALTGHLVLSTIHTNSAWGIVSRLVDMGVPPFLLSGTLNTAVAQRLLRLLCPKCKVKEPLEQSQLPGAHQTSGAIADHYVAKGCAHCHYTGYKGRKAIYEVVPIDQELSRCIRNNNLEVGELLKNRKIASLADNAFDLFGRGETSLDEIYPILLAS